MKHLIVAITILLTGCGTLHFTPANSVIPSESPLDFGSRTEEVIAPVAVAAMAPPPPPEPVVMSDIPKMSRIQPNMGTVRKVADKVTDALMSAAEAATTTEKETITSDPAGNIIKREETKEHQSFLTSLIQLIGLITGSLGLYVGVKKLRTQRNDTQQTNSLKV